MYLHRGKTTLAFVCVHELLSTPNRAFTQSAPVKRHRGEPGHRWSTGCRVCVSCLKYKLHVSAKYNDLLSRTKRTVDQLAQELATTNVCDTIV
jgi:hypothetical protein